MKNNDPKKCYYCKNFYLTSTDIPGEFKCKNRTNCTKEVESCESFEERELYGEAIADLDKLVSLADKSAKGKED